MRRDRQKRVLLLPLSLLLSLVAAACGPGASPGILTSTRPSGTSTVAAVRTATLAPGSPTARAATSTLAPATPTAIASTPATVPAPGMTVAPPTVVSGPTAAGTGVLTGHASIGPLTPVERVGVPSPTPGPQVCTSRGLAIYAADGTTLVTSFSFQPDCTYRVALPPGTYVVRLKDERSGIGGSKTLPRTVSLESGQTVVLDIDIDTGIR